MENVSSIPRDIEKKIEIHGGAGELGVKVFKVRQWKNKCKQYFDRYFKTSTIIFSHLMGHCHGHVEFCVLLQ